MLQLKTQTKPPQQSHTQNITPSNRESKIIEQDLPLRRGELATILEQFSFKEQRLTKTIEQLQSKNKELSSALEAQQPSKHEYQRCRHLLSIKEQLILAQQKEIQQLKSSLQKITHKLPLQIAKNPSCIDINEISKIDCLQEWDSGQKENRGLETKRKICLKKNTKQSKNSIIFRGEKGGLAEEGHKLEIARLKSEIGKLKGVIEGLHVQLRIADIQMGHLSRDCQLTSKRQRKLHQTLTRVLRQQQVKKGEENSLSQKCEMLQRYIDKLTDKMQKMDLNAHLRKAHDAPPPITPHFSNTAAFVFPTSRKTPTKLQSPPADEIFQACCEQDLPERQ